MHIYIKKTYLNACIYIYTHAYAYVKCVYPVCGSYSMMNVFCLYDIHYVNCYTLMIYDFILYNYIVCRLHHLITSL